jgi:hypothetical protein
MKHVLRLFFLLLCLIISLSIGYAQVVRDRIVSGVFRDKESSSPLPGVNVVIKGTSIGVITDVEGRYSIRVAIGDVLVFSFVGFTPKEVVVTDKNSDPADGIPKKVNPFAQNQNTKNEPQQKEEKPQKPIPNTNALKRNSQKGVAVLNDSTPSYVLKKSSSAVDVTLFGREIVGWGTPRNTKKIVFISPKKATRKYGSLGVNGVYYLKSQDPSYSYGGGSSHWKFAFSSSLTADRANLLPSLQNQFSQGSYQNGQEVWRGAETSEMYSWGAKISNLEYKNGDYRYDQNGALTAKGTGNGNPAQVYNPYRFFRTGLTSNQQFNVNFNKSWFNLRSGIVWEKQNGVIPSQTSDNTGLYLKLSAHRRINYTYSVNWSKKNQSLVQGVNLVNLMSGVMTTPPTFDNLNLNQLSYTPAQNNPYFLANALPDRNQTQFLSSQLQIEKNWTYFNLKVISGLERQDKQDLWGIPTEAVGAEQGRLIDRRQENLNFNQIAQLSWDKYFDIGLLDLNLKANLIYQFTHQGSNLSRKDGFNFQKDKSLAFDLADSVQNFSANLQRNFHEPQLQLSVSINNDLVLDIHNRAYFSSTSPKSYYFLPYLGFSFNITKAFSIYSEALSNLKIRGNYAKNVHEASLIYGKWHFQSTAIPTASYLNYFENQELTFKQGLQAENLNKYEIGLESQWLNHAISLEINYFQHFTQNAIFPVAPDGQFAFQNMADLKTKGFEAVLTLQNRYYKDFRISGNFNVTVLRPTVEKLHGQMDRVPLAGFSDASMNLVEGEPLGVIYGTAYARNAQGEKIIGNDGFPLISKDLQFLGNPNPKWNLGINGGISFRAWTLAFLWDWRYGGERWNGTSNVLNYLGRSELTANERNTRNYIFEGVTEMGQTNARPVDFANPTNGLEANRWVRYGTAGVAEDAIQKASFLRLSEVKLTYNFHLNFLQKIRIRTANISLIARNLLLFTPYGGTDPATSLFGYGIANGLDLFNAPNTRSFGASMNLEF